ncbi:MAG: glycosyltransferase [Chloroflexi bacterium]|nr:glycosyltransferase [Chloroflexota bacterium]
MPGRKREPAGRPIRVLTVIESLEAGGAQRHVLSLAKCLGRSGFRLAVATSGDEPLGHEFRGAGIPVYTLVRESTRERLSPLFAARLSRLAVRGDFDIIHGHLHTTRIAAAVAARVSGLPLVLTHHSMDDHRPTWHRALGRWADRQADAVIAVATNLADYVARSGVTARVIRNGVDIPDRLWSDADRLAARARLGVPGGAYLISYVGRFFGEKNPLLFVEMAARVSAHCPNAHFLMIGDGPLRAEAEARSHALDIADRMTFAGFRSDAAELHQAVDVLTLTSDTEGTPLVVLEAMAVSRPVVATAVGDVPAQVADGTTGFVVAPCDAAALASAVLRLADASLRQRLGQAGRERVRREFTVERCLSATAAVYREAVERRGPGCLDGDDRAAA